MPNSNKRFILLSSRENKQLDSVEEYFKFNNEDSVNFASWYPTFINSISEEIYNFLDSVNCFVTKIKKLDEETFKTRLEKNQYLTYQEIGIASVILSKL